MTTMHDLSTVLPVLDQEAAAGERAGRLTPPTVQVLAKAGFFTPAPPQGRSIPVLYEALVGLGAADASAAWVVATSMTAQAVAVLGLGRGAATALLPPHTPTGGSGHLSGRVDGPQHNVRVTGSWGWVSGADVAEVFVLGAQGQQGPVVVAVAASDVIVHRDWDAVGLQATGSQRVSVKEVAPVAVGDLALTAEVVAFSAVTLAAAVLGAAIGGQEVVRDRLPAELCQAPAWLHAQRLVQQACDVGRAAADTAAQTGEEMDLAHAHRIRGELALAVRSALSAFETFFDALGSSAFRAGHPLQRHWRDACVGARHPLLRVSLAGS